MCTYFPNVFIRMYTFAAQCKYSPVDLAAHLILQHAEFEMRLATCLGLDDAVASLLSGEFACDAVITRAQQLARQEVSTGTSSCVYVRTYASASCCDAPAWGLPQTQSLLEKQAIVHRLQQRLKINKQALDSKDLHIGVLQKKIASLQERIASYNSTQSQVDSLEKKVCYRSVVLLLVYCCAASFHDYAFLS